MFSTYIGAHVLKTLKWSGEIDEVFRDNLKNKDPTLKWQYFGSHDAVFRTYPGNNNPTFGGYFGKTRGPFILVQLDRSEIQSVNARMQTEIDLNELVRTLS